MKTQWRIYVFKGKSATDFLGPLLETHQWDSICSFGFADKKDLYKIY